MKKLLQGKELEEYARKIGVDISVHVNSSTNSIRASDHEIQRRIMEAQRSKREASLWLIALISAIASALSAITAIIAVVGGK